MKKFFATLTLAAFALTTTVVLAQDAKKEDTKTEKKAKKHGKKKNDKKEDEKK